jgi:uncharacterized repeat protein (TIGR03803 family)
VKVVWPEIGFASGLGPTGTRFLLTGVLISLLLTSGAGTLTAATFQVLHPFSLGPESPASGLIQDAAGNLYGTTLAGGVYGYGTIFKLDTSDNLTTLYSFAGADGGSPYASLIMDSSGNLYGTTYYGGADSQGTVFRLDPANRLTTLHSFTGGAEGRNPQASLIMDASGNLYGTTDSRFVK